MTTISSVQHIIAVINSELNKSVNSARGAPLNKNKRVQAKSGGEHREAASNLNEWISKRVHALNPDDPQRSRKVFRIFLETVLLDEFGKEKINDAAFYQLVERVHTAMDESVELAPLIEEAIDSIITGKIK